MPINFPNSPSPNQLYSYDNKTWEWNGTYWEVYSGLTSYVGGTGNVNYVSKWSGVNSLTDSLIQDDGTQVNIGGTQYLGSRFSVDGPVGVNGAQIQFKNTSIGITDSDLTSWGSTSGEIAIGIGGPLLSSTGYNNIAVGNQSMSANTSGYGNIGIGKGVLANNTTGYHNVAIGEESLYSNNTQRRNVAIGYQAGYSTTGDSSVFIGNQAGYNETGSQKLYIANSTTPLIYGEFNNNIVGIIGTLTATTYNNLPVSAITSGNGISASTSNGTVTVVNTQVQGITGKTDGAGISSSISNNVITITNTDLGSSQNIFKNIQITGTTQFSAGSNSSNLNFSGVNINIFSAASNTLVFSAGTAGSGTVTSVALSAGTSGSDINIVNSAITTSGTITINIPDASISARGVVSTGTQTLKGNKTFDGTIGSLNFVGNRILYSTNTLIIDELNTTTYPSLTELSYVKGVTSAIQTQLNNKFNTSGGTITGNLTITGNTTISGLSASQLIATDANDTLVSLSTTTYPSLTELTYVKGVTSAIQTQLNNKFNTSGGTINGNLTVTGTTTSATISATTYQNILASSISNSTTVGQNLITLPNPSAISYLRINADNTVTALTLAQLKSDLGLIRSVQANTVSNSSSSVAVNITGCTVSLDANSTYIGKMTIGSGCAGAGGFTLTFTFPSGASMYLGRNIGTTATNNQVQTWVQITSGTAIGQTFNQANNQTFYHELQIYVVTAATSGSLTPSFLTVTNGTASTIYAFITQMQLEKIS